MSLNVDAVLSAFDQERVQCLLIGGMNFFLRHSPETTFDIDLWVKNSDDNLLRVNNALIRIKAEWGPTEHDWKPVPSNAAWLKQQPCFCLTTAFGAVDIFREVQGLEQQFEVCFDRAVPEKTASGVPYRALADIDMLRCQEVLEPEFRKEKRIQVLKAALKNASRNKTV